jgi:aldose 1-epimerase
VTDVAGRTAVAREPFGALPDGTAVDRWTLDDGTATVAVITYGGALQQIVVPDRDGARADVTLGFDDLAGYLGPQPYFGALVGRYANRIAQGRFDLNGRTYQLDRNHRGHALHGGWQGFTHRVWAAQELPGTGVRLSLTSPDGDQGYPARLDVTVAYTLDGGVLTLEYAATNAEPDGGPDTVVNLTNHAYFNLEGHAAGPVGEHLVQVPWDRFVVSDEGLIPTGAFADVAGTPLDLREARPFAAGWDADTEQIRNAGGYDHSWLVDATPGGLAVAARVIDPTSGRMIEVATDQPAIHVYSGNMMEPIHGAKDGATYPWRGGFCLETHHLADSPNHPTFPTTVLHPGQTFRTTTAFTFTLTSP